MIRVAFALGLSQSGFHAFVASLPIAMVAVGETDATIGAVMGWAAVVGIVAAVVSGALIDRYGGRAVYLAGAACFAAATLLLALGIAAPGGSELDLLVVRSLQGIGVSAVMPAAMSLVPAIVPAARLGTALAFVGVAANVSLAIVPPISLLVLDAAGLRVLAAGTGVAVLIGAVLAWPVHDPEAAQRASTRAERRLTLRPAWRAAWAAPLLVTVLFLAHWGVVTGYLPQRAEAAGADVGLFFTGDAIALLVLRVPAGWLAGRIGSLPLVVTGLAVTAAALIALMAPPTTTSLIAACVGTGAGGAFVLPTLLLELSHRSDASDRGSAFALFSVAFGAGISAGSIGIAPVFTVLGFETALGLGAACCGLAGAIALFDRAMRHPPLALEEAGPAAAA